MAPEILHSPFELIESLVDLSEPVVDLIESLVDLIEPLVDLIEPLVDLIEPLVDLIEPLVDLIEPLVDTRLQRDEIPVRRRFQRKEIATCGRLIKILIEHVVRVACFVRHSSIVCTMRSGMDFAPIRTMREKRWHLLQRGRRGPTAESAIWFALIEWRLRGFRRVGQKPERLPIGVG